MRTRNVGLYAVVVFAMLMAGCGRAVSPLEVERTVGTEEDIPVLPNGLGTVVSKDKVRTAPSPVVGVEVDGRFYPKGDEPQVVATPSPAAPQSGKGHLHAQVSLANRTGSFIDRIEVQAKLKGQGSAAFSHVFTKKMLVGTKLSVTATNLAPGDYEVNLTVFGRQGVYARSSESARVDAGKTVETKI